MASRFSFYSFRGCEFLISTITFFDISNYIFDIKNSIVDINNYIFDIKNLILDINNYIFTSEMSP